MEKKRIILFNENEIHNRIVELASEIDDYYGSESFVVISLLRGSFIFASDLVRSLNSMVTIDFITTSSYDNEKISSGFVEIVNDLRENIADRHVLLVDDILDSGKTMKYVVDHLEKRNPKSIKTCVLLDKPSRRTEDIKADFVGYEIEDVFIVGYGLNYGDYYRNVPYIFTFDDES
ncbi:hypoxanthine phosphoribosyltransferase [Microaceticoccus formicicus]|uniref:hypoxanthine phosphoribosyltransferase n=1 Tax=Microaceticoccus formicicus TaxID=3118105 RepID=UPI003CD00508|nr:hypoxanthine phosphoribosyltransferase [Peptoniphilaceae bacterium AMB_02]